MRMHSSLRALWVSVRPCPVPQRNRWFGSRGSRICTRLVQLHTLVPSPGWPPAEQQTVPRGLPGRVGAGGARLRAPGARLAGAPGPGPGVLPHIPPARPPREGGSEACSQVRASSRSPRGVWSLQERRRVRKSSRPQMDHSPCGSRFSGVVRMSPALAARRWRHSPTAMGRVPPSGLGKASRRLAVRSAATSGVESPRSN
ncbi:hypothetical protein CLOM_g13735 [Closterium sp. NIES-68]|nr:hypothetical protein CLOM_g13735 [Closterium sp. NIES-68]